MPENTPQEQAQKRGREEFARRQAGEILEDIRQLRDNLHFNRYWVAVLAEEKKHAEEVILLGVDVTDYKAWLTFLKLTERLQTRMERDRMDAQKILNPPVVEDGNLDD